MSDKFVKIIIAILPPFISGFMGFLLARLKKDNLDNMKITYNRIYFPIYKYIILNSNIEKQQLIEYSKKYIEKHFKYVDKSTYNCFKKLEEEMNDKTLNEFKNNIVQINSYLRRKLNYLESNSFKVYAFSTYDQKIVQLIIYTSISYGLFFASGYFAGLIYTIFCIIAFIFITASIIILFQLAKKRF